MLARSAKKAFTLLELIVVIVILGILALIAIPTFAAVIDRTRASSVQRAAESLGREAVALAAFDSDADGSNEVLQADLTAAEADLDVTGYTVSALLADANGAAAGTLPGFTMAQTVNGTTYTATVTIDGNVVRSTVATS